MMLVTEKQGINSEYILEINMKDVADIQEFCVMSQGERKLRKTGKNREKLECTDMISY